MAERHPLSDQVLVILKRAWPGEVDKDDLIEQAGLSPQDLRGALDSLRAAGELDESGENFAWLNPDDPERTGDGIAAGSPEDEADEEDLEGRLSLPDHNGRRVQATFTVVGSFAPGRGQTDEGITKQANHIATEIGNMLGTGIPNLGANVTVARVQIYDNPRVLFDAETGIEEPEESAVPD